MSLALFRVSRWFFLGVSLIVIIRFSRFYYFQHKSILLPENINVADKPINSITVKFKNTTNPTTSLRHHEIYGAPEICGNEWQSKYRELHDDIINRRREPKFLVYSCPWTNKGCCGYGNRVRAMVSLFYLAILTNRAFLIDWTAPKPLEHFLKPKGIDWNFPIPHLETRKHYWRTGGEKDKIRGGWLARNTSQFVAWIRSENIVNYLDKPVEIATSNLFFAQNGIQKNKFLMKIARELKIRPLLSRTPKYAMIGCAYDFLFQPKESLQNALKNTRKALREKGAYVIGIHIRLGDQQFGRKNSTRVDDFPKFFSCAKRVERAIFSLASKTNKRQTRWFLATDSILVKHYARKHYPNKIITDSNKPEHLDIYKWGERPSEEGMMGVLHDHYILAESDFLVLSESSFSRTAVGLSLRRPESYTFGDNCDLNFKKSS